MIARKNPSAKRYALFTQSVRTALRISAPVRVSVAATAVIEALPPASWTVAQAAIVSRRIVSQFVTPYIGGQDISTCLNIFLYCSDYRFTR